MEKNFFVKSHALGNDYIVMDGDKIDFDLTKDEVIRICDVHYGIGSDGLLLKVPSGKADFGLRIFNPDGSEAEKSGNGLRIFCKFLFDYEYAKARTFTVETKGGVVTAQIEEVLDNKASLITVDMGKAVFTPEDIPVKLGGFECIDRVLEIDNTSFKINCVSLGNPHCVIIRESLSVEEIKKFGPKIETCPIFPNRVNVQFAKPVSENEVEILIWERGAGYTLASGSSSCAVASVMVKKGITARELRVKMPGGSLEISVLEDWNIKMKGPAVEIARGVLSS